MDATIPAEFNKIIMNVDAHGVEQCGLSLILFPDGTRISNLSTDQAIAILNALPHETTTSLDDDEPNFGLTTLEKATFADDDSLATKVQRAVQFVA